MRRHRDSQARHRAHSAATLTRRRPRQRGTSRRIAGSARFAFPRWIPLPIPIIDMRRERVSSAEIAALDSAGVRYGEKVMTNLRHDLTRDSQASALWLWFAFGALALAWFPALRGRDPLWGWLPFWLIVAPLLGLAV